MPTITEQLMTPPVQQNPTNVVAENKDLQYATEALFSDDNLMMKTELSLSQINALTRGHLYANEFGSSLMEKLCVTMETLMISKSRQGRKEITEITRNIRGDAVEKQKGLLPSLMGL